MTDTGRGAGKRFNLDLFRNTTGQIDMQHNLAYGW